jgi:hypothetical protein
MSDDDNGNGGIDASGLFGMFGGPANVPEFIQKIGEALEATNANATKFQVIGPAMLRHIAKNIEKDGYPCPCGFTAAMELLKIVAERGGFENVAELMAMYLARDASAMLREDLRPQMFDWLTSEQTKEGLLAIPNLVEQNLEDLINDSINRATSRKAGTTGGNEPADGGGE